MAKRLSRYNGPGAEDNPPPISRGEIDEQYGPRVRINGSPSRYLAVGRERYGRGARINRETFDSMSRPRSGRMEIEEGDRGNSFEV